MWPIFGTLQCNILLQLQLYCLQKGKWIEISYIRAFVELSQDPILRKNCKMLVARAVPQKGNGGELDVLDDPLCCGQHSPAGLGQLRAHRARMKRPAGHSSLNKLSLF